MATVCISDATGYTAASSQDLIRLRPTAALPPIHVRKGILELVVLGICSRRCIHLSGPSGTGKSSLIEALAADLPDQPGTSNFLLAQRRMAGTLAGPERPLRLFPVEMCRFESPAELYTRRALRDGSTYDEDSPLVTALSAAWELGESCYPLIWLRELGRVQAANVMSGLLNLVTRTDILLPDGRQLPGRQFVWIADSNYAANPDDHTLVAFDAALRRRFDLNITLEPLSADEEAAVLRQVLRGKRCAQREKLIAAAVTLGRIVRRQQDEGLLRSLPPPSLYGYGAFIDLATALPHRDWQDIALATMLGNADRDDARVLPAVIAEAIGEVDGATVAPGTGRRRGQHLL